MKISTMIVRAISALTLAAGLLTAGFGPAGAVESTDTNRGNGDQTQASTANRSGPRPRTARRKVITGVASYYGKAFHGKRTASGERFNMNAMTLASRRLPLGTRVKVTNLRTGKSAVARVNDIGPNGRHRSRVADLSKGLAQKIGLSPAQGLTKVRLEVIK